MKRCLHLKVLPDAEVSGKAMLQLANSSPCLVFSLRRVAVVYTDSSGRQNMRFMQVGIEIPPCSATTYSVPLPPGHTLKGCRVFPSELKLTCSRKMTGFDLACHSIP